VASLQSAAATLNAGAELLQRSAARNVMNDFRALLLTDVVDSTKLAESIGDAAMADVWTAHDRVARDLLQTHRGREIDKTDGMLMMFDGAADAVSFAMDYHKALAALRRPLSARAGLHFGAVLLRENSADDIARGAKPIEVEGLAKPTAARVMSLARGGQTLMTTEARDNLGPTELKVESLGHWMIKGVEEPIELFEVGPPAARFTPPPDSEKVYRVVRAAEWWLPVRDISNNLPHQSTSFVGREAELAEVKALLDKVRLLTLLGMGGLGKTRLELQVAAESIHLFPDGVWFLDLAPLRDEALVCSVAAQVIGVQQEPDRPLLQSVCARLKARRALIVLDNCEHLIKASAELAHAILRAAPHVRVLASSREALHVPGEQSYPLHPLPIPARDAGPEQLMQSPAVRLFVERARQSNPAFALDAAHAPAVAELVARLEGIPLALELAAARVRALSVVEINNRLKDRYKILTGGARVLQERQQTLRALVDWSFDLLTKPEQILFARLSVFVGGFDLEAAEQVCGVEPLAREDVLDLLASLVDKSLVLRDEHEDSGRYGMLETIRDYARERLEQVSELDVFSVRHGEHYFAFSKSARDGVLGAEQAEWIRRIESNLDNLRGAIAIALKGGIDNFVAVKMAVALEAFWMLRGYATEGRRIIRAALALPTIQMSDLAHAWALYVGATLATSQSDHGEARQMLERCLALRRRLGNPVEIAATLSTLSLAQLQAGDAMAAADGEREALRIFRETGDRQGEVVSLLHLAQAAFYVGNDAEAGTILEKCLAIARDIRQQQLEGECELQSGEIAFWLGDLERAVLWFKRSLTLCREAADKRGEANAQRWLGKCDLCSRERTNARSRLADALRAFKSFEMWDELLGCLEDFAELCQLEGHPNQSIRLSAATQRARERLGLTRSPRAEIRQAELVAGYKAAMQADGSNAWNEGRKWDVEDAVRNALNAGERSLQTA
jgi:predicted ATPase/class 3 adenylate cyclase